MASPILTISIKKGPKQGETVECKPCSAIRIGRIVRGNTLTIKDPSISQKHLTLRFLPEIDRWVVTDLGSSNGTCINGGLITPEEPYPVADGDVIKIGEKTAISVTISAPAVEPVAVPRHRRPPRPPKGAASQVVLEDKEDVEEENAQRAKRRGRRGKGSIRTAEEVGDQEPVMKRRMMTRASARSVSSSVSKLEEDDAGREDPSKDCNADIEGKEATVEEAMDDMDKMTLGEWFIRMERYLPKAINMVAEEIIDKLREKARRFDEYVDQISTVGVE